MLFKIIVAMLAFAANSVLCRLALADQQIDPMSFSIIRVSSGAIVLLIIWLLTTARLKIEWNIKNAIFLAIYILAFSYAYIKIDAGVGALLLFGTVQLTMVFYGIFHGEKLSLRRGLGLVLALFGIIVLLLPGADAPSLFYSLIMGISGLAWAAYSISGKRMLNPLSSTLANFIVAMPIILIASFIFRSDIFMNTKGIVLAMISGGLTSSGAYVLWYSIVKKLDRIAASTVQLSVPCLAILGGSLFIGESVSLRVILSTIMVLFGIVLVIFATTKKTASTINTTSINKT
ncbi:DMT family transporter [Acinetobacter sp. ANC 4648]|uniref:DMT family transporter n=1 Tax=Acinetobacter sp. ANC 4648 TaxID=1977875 RepID=UPI000A33B743|nr:DMT family transporter [Acinetobacter sp. ANC 4648]OTG81568.1 EamA family transporter [Acinetobacter sp. ANC 4648]